jgi:GT2 family glycosyltransferase
VPPGGPVTGMIDLSIIIVNWNTKQLLLDCISSIESTVRRATYEIIVVDNASTDGSVQAVSAAYPAVRMIVNSRNLGFGPANNIALHQMQGRYAVLLNSDTVLKDAAFDILFDFMEAHLDAGMCGPRLLNADGSHQTSVGTFPSVLSEFASKLLVKILAPAAYDRAFTVSRTAFAEPAVVDFIIGACMMVRKEAMDEAGMLDEDYFFFYEEIDWCFRMHRAGWPVYHLPHAEIYHLGGGSSKNVSLRARAESWRSRYLFFRKSLELGRAGTGALFLLGLSQVAYQFTGYSVMNVLTLFSIRRLRRRWSIFGYLFLWHLRGCPDSMGLPR